jgi:DNA-binding NarL/FixJ family response regulator
MSLEQGSKKAVSPSIGILVVEDFEPLRQLICNVLRNWSQHAIVDETADGLESVERARELQPDLVLIDIGLPRLNGLEAARQIRRIVPDAKLLFVSQEFSVEIVREAFRLQVNTLLVAVLGTESVRAYPQLILSDAAILRDTLYQNDLARHS